MEAEHQYERIKSELAFANTKWHMLLKDFEKLQEEHRRTIAENQQETELLRALQTDPSPVKDENMIDYSNQAAYDPVRDRLIQSLKDEIQTIREIDKNLHESTVSALEEYVASMKDRIQSRDINTKYNKLLVKYYKSCEQIKALQQFIGLKN